MKTAVIYDRASRVLQKDNWSREDARHIGTKLANQYGYSQAELLIEVQSGESLLNRPVMKDILERAEACSIGAIIVQNFSRLTRDEDGLDGLTIKKVCKDNDVLIITPGKVYDFSTDQDDKLSDIEFMMGRWYKAELMKFTAQGLKARARAGAFMGGTPTFGYKLVYHQNGESDKPKADLVIDDNEAKTVRVLFDLYVNHRLGANGTAKQLNELGYTIRQRAGGNRQFCTQDILRLIASELYIGFMKWGHSKHGRKGKYLQDFEGTMIHRPELQIIPITLWEQAQAIKKKRTRKHNKKRGQWAQYAFSGVCGCPVCGSELSAHKRTNGRDDRRYIRYFCASHRRKDNGCPGFGISEKLIADVLLPFVAETINEKIDLTQALNEAADQFGRTPLEDSIINEIEAEIVATQEQKKRLIDSIADGILTKTEAGEKLEEIRGKLERLQRKLVDTQRADEIRQEYLEAMTAIRGVNLETRFFEMLDQNPALLKRILELIFKYASVKVKSTGTGTKGGNFKGGHKGELIAYEFTEDFKDVFCKQSRGELYKIDPYITSLSELVTIAA